MVWEGGQRVGLGFSCLELWWVNTDSYNCVGMFSQLQPNFWALPQCEISCAGWAFHFMSWKGAVQTVGDIIALDWLCIQSNAMVPLERLIVVWGLVCSTSGELRHPPGFLIPPAGRTAAILGETWKEIEAMQNQAWNLRLEGTLHLVPSQTDRNWASRRNEQSLEIWITGSCFTIVVEMPCYLPSRP